MKQIGECAAIPSRISIDSVTAYFLAAICCDCPLHCKAPSTTACQSTPRLSTTCADGLLTAFTARGTREKQPQHHAGSRIGCHAPLCRRAAANRNSCRRRHRRRHGATAAAGTGAQCRAVQVVGELQVRRCSVLTCGTSCSMRVCACGTLLCLAQPFCMHALEL